MIAAGGELSIRISGVIAAVVVEFHRAGWQDAGAGGLLAADIAWLQLRIGRFCQLRGGDLKHLLLIDGTYGFAFPDAVIIPAPVWIEVIGCFFCLHGEGGHQGQEQQGDDKLFHECTSVLLKD